MADNAPNPPLPQPDFHLISQQHQILAGEMAKIPNLPQFETGNTILHELQQINTKLDRLDTAVQEIKTTIQTSDRNNIARIANSQLAASTGALTPLISLTENTPIAGFPLIPGDIELMQLGTLNAVMRELGSGLEGQRATKGQRLRVFIGLKKSPA